MTNLDSIFKSRDITLSTKIHFVKAVVFPVVMYGCESWTIKKAECWKIDALHPWQTTAYIAKSSPHYSHAPSTKYSTVTYPMPPPTIKRYANIVNSPPYVGARLTSMEHNSCTSAAKKEVKSQIFQHCIKKNSKSFAHSKRIRTFASLSRKASIWWL